MILYRQEQRGEYVMRSSWNSWFRPLKVTAGAVESLRLLSFARSQFLPASAEIYFPGGGREQVQRGHFPWPLALQT